MKIVTQAGCQDLGEGYFVIIDYENGVTSTYSHLKDVPNVSVGDEVEQGQTIRYLGYKRMATAPILTFFIAENAKLVDPQTYI